MAEKRRLTIELPASVRETIEVLRQKTCAESATEVIRRAISLYDTVVHANGEVRLIFERPDGTHEVALVPKGVF